MKCNSLKIPVSYTNVEPSTLNIISIKVSKKFKWLQWKTISLINKINFQVQCNQYNEKWMTRRDTDILYNITNCSFTHIELSCLILAYYHRNFTNKIDKLLTKNKYNFLRHVYFRLLDREIKKFLICRHTKLSKASIVLEFSIKE